MPAPSPLRGVRPLLLSATILALTACGGQESRTSDGTDGGSDEGGPSRGVALADDQLGSLERKRVTLSVPWTVRRLSRDADPDSAPSVVREISAESLPGADRLVLRFGSADPMPGFRVEGTVEGVERCETGDTIPARDGGGHLRLILTRASLAEDVEARPANASTLANVTSIDLACRTRERLEWVLGVESATAYRLVLATDPPRLAVDVRHSRRQGPDSAETAGGGPPGG